MLDLAVSSTEESNIDFLPFDDDSLVRIRNFGNETSDDPPTIIYDGYYSATTDDRVRRLSMRLPGEPLLQEGAVISWTYDVFKNDYVVGISDQLKADDPAGDGDRSWGWASGRVVVTKREGRAVTFTLDATLQPTVGGTGVVRLQGTIFIDFARQPNVIPDEEQ